MCAVYFYCPVGLHVYILGNHGLGDTARIPIGYFKVLEEINGNYAYTEHEINQQIGIRTFALGNDNLYGEVQGGLNSERAEYVVWNLRTGESIFYRTEAEYLAVSSKKQYPKPAEFEEFFKHYQRHWNGWRWWFLP